MVFKLENALELPGRLAETQSAGPYPRVLDSVGLGWVLRMCMSNKFQGDADMTTF